MSRRKATVESMIQVAVNQAMREKRYVLAQALIEVLDAEIREADKRELAKKLETNEADA